ncbi:hypothetical protein Pint_10167 [Pistacia integerrima]|uniref:Uncharacterized protein n=1 Tax=Pistacia integerrima TaxID=434235 RepID=A0ACC0XN16_9ROSI|nr:hypothetical protein Pint_10167 [Pistacia integerrima]
MFNNGTVSLKCRKIRLQMKSRTAGFKAALPSHGADQWDMSRFFNGLWLALCIGGAISSTLILWIQDRGFGLCTTAILLAVIIFGVGLPLYRFQVVQGTSAIKEILQV